LSYTRKQFDCKWLVGLVGLEPTTSCSQSTRATKLRHSPIRGKGTSQPLLVTDDSYVGHMELEVAVLERVRAYKSMSRWERSELGKDLRRLGLSYGEIMDLIPVKKSTLATWCRDVDLTMEQVEAIRKRRAQEPGIPRNTQRKRWAEIESIRLEARTQVESLLNDHLWLAGTVLYWAEGSKTRNQLRLANTDPKALRLFVAWVRGYIDPDASFSMQLHLHEGNDENAARCYWRRETGLARANFYKTFIKPKGTGHRNNRIPYGVCSVKVRRCADGWHTAMAWIEALSPYLGLDRPD
jgi:hypothetical protein